MSSVDVDEFIQQNRAVADQVEKFRGYWESDKHWVARREFILRNISDYEEEQLDHLLSLSMVWANNVFMGCRSVAQPAPTAFTLLVVLLVFLITEEIKHHRYKSVGICRKRLILLCTVYSFRLLKLMILNQ